MQAVLFIGIPASGKSTFFQQRFFDTHVRINLDMLKTRHRERLLVQACLDAKQPLVIDNTNVSAKARKPYIQAAKAVGFRVVGYYFRSVIAESLERNETRERVVPERGIKAMAAQLEIPRLEEGFDQLHYVRIEEGVFRCTPWDPES